MGVADEKLRNGCNAAAHTKLEPLDDGGFDAQRRLGDATMRRSRSRPTGAPARRPFRSISTANSSPPNRQQSPGVAKLFRRDCCCHLLPVPGRRCGGRSVSLTLFKVIDVEQGDRDVAHRSRATLLRTRARQLARRRLRRIWAVQSESRDLSVASRLRRARSMVAAELRAVKTVEDFGAASAAVYGPDRHQSVELAERLDRPASSSSLEPYCHGRQRRIPSSARWARRVDDDLRQ